MLLETQEMYVYHGPTCGISIDESINFMLNDLTSSSWMEPKWGNIFAENKRPRSLLSSGKNMYILDFYKLENSHNDLKFEELVYEKNCN